MDNASVESCIEEILKAIDSGQVVPYLGPGILGLSKEGASLPQNPEMLSERLASLVAVPSRIRKNLWSTSQYIENYRHRKTLKALLSQLFDGECEPNELQQWIARIPRLPLVVDVWYDGSLSLALKERPSWGQIQGVSQAEYPGSWVKAYNAEDKEVEISEAYSWNTVLYKPLGSVKPQKNFIISDSDYVEVLTEIDIQTPIPDLIKELRKAKQFLFLGCRFQSQIERTWARQITKRSSSSHWAVISSPLTKNEARFLSELNIKQLDISLEDFVQKFLSFSPASSL
ncbi:SIR2 family NAD-dependent protein deacylase [Methylacidiphilum caldifontis]|uniref:Transcriptional regulator n=1 Tax=Methylacidiphilum caldifontis TaxID=2795386 RepID=A0A4Y8PB47_9BACT|nr:SIR2 family protein [Methylacidiphilum caldifontis]QSR89468.1 SIR2 family protein [Methylacidiphilum caldifontis]TFE67930.1 transcriptional regulator [Methylacidiphilum caldifontis]